MLYKTLQDLPRPANRPFSFSKHNNMKVVAKMSLLPGSLLSLSTFLPQPHYVLPTKISQCSTRNITCSVRRIGCQRDGEDRLFWTSKFYVQAPLFTCLRLHEKKLLESGRRQEKEHSKAWAKISPIITTAAYWKLFTKHIYIVQLLLFITNKANL